MESRTLQYIAAAAGARLISGDPQACIRRVCTDSRQAQEGDLFIALSGERFDGHDFLPTVAAKGVTAVMVENDKLSKWDYSNTGAAVLSVDKNREAFGCLAARYRKDFSPETIAVAGSNGKTTTKELIASVLRQQFSTLWSEASFNNDIGVPHTLLRLDSTHRAAVLEIGTNHPGELAPLIRLVQPKFGIITSIGREHLEYFGDIDGVVREEGSLAELLPSNGRLFIHGDNPICKGIAARSCAPVVRLGFGPSNDWTAAIVEMNDSGSVFTVQAPKADFNGTYSIGLLGRHQVGNALFAIALGAELGMDKNTIQAGLSQSLPAKMRLQLWSAHGVRVLDDAYNANADSMLAALDTLHTLACNGRRIAVLGEMAELGNQSEAAHAEVGRKVGMIDKGVLFAVGAKCQIMAQQARLAGGAQVMEFDTVEAAAASLKNFLKEGDTVLLKASRSARLERIAETIRNLN